MLSLFIFLSISLSLSLSTSLSLSLSPSLSLSLSHTHTQAPPHTPWGSQKEPSPSWNCLAGNLKENKFAPRRAWWLRFPGWSMPSLCPVLKFGSWPPSLSTNYVSVTFPAAMPQDRKTVRSSNCGDYSDPLALVRPLLWLGSLWGSRGSYGAMELTYTYLVTIVGVL